MTTPLATELPMTATTGKPVTGQVQGAPARLPRAWYVTAAVLPLLLLGAWGLTLLPRATPAAGLALVGEPAPNFALTDLHGNLVQLSSLRGRPVIVHFWASWCGPCVEEFPVLLKASAAHRGDDLAIVGIVYNDSAAAAGALMTRMGATWPATIDPAGGVATQYGIIGPPDTFFVDRSGVIVGRQIGQLSAADLQHGLSQILGKE